MNEDLNNLEKEAEEMLKNLSPMLSADPRPATIERIKSAIRHELNEQWLADQPAPTPTGDTMQNVRNAVDNELKKSATHRWLRPRIWAPLAAAAMIALYVGLTQFAPTPQPTKPDTTAIDLFVQAAEEIFIENVFTLAANMDIDAIEDNINNLGAGLDYQTESLNQIGNEIDELFYESDYTDIIPTGVVG